ncbi:MAG: hypothetical protein HQL46_16320 [Gammaproteobacteria bacterium]|nr:hypothetical protein [Gammaproteobacteria bacterium]
MLDKEQLLNCQEFLTTFDDKSKELILLLVSHNLLVASRTKLANLQLNSNNTYGFNSSVWIELGFNQSTCQPQNNFFNGLKGIWLLEKKNKELIFLGNSKESKCISGKTLHQFNIFSDRSSHINELIEQLVSVCMVSETFQQFYKSNLSKQFSLTQIRQILYKLENIRVNKAIDFFKSSLDSKILDVLQNYIPANAYQYNYFVTANEIIQRNRLQAANSYPFLIPTLTDNFYIRQCIDNGNSLQIEILKQLGITKGVLKYLRTHAQYFDIQFLNFRNIQNLGNFSIDTLPKTERDINTYCHHSDKLIELANYLKMNPQKLAGSLTNGWYQGINSLEKILNMPVDITLILNMFKEMPVFLLMPIQKKLFNRIVIQSSQQLAIDWYANESLKDLLLIAKKWHNFYFSIQTSHRSLINYQNYFH